MKNKKLNLTQLKKEKKKDELSIDIIEIEQNEKVILKFNFRHKSTNEILSMSRKDFFSYKTHVKTSIKNILQNDEKFYFEKPFKKYSLNCIVGTARGRDLDSFGLTIKPFLDSLQDFYVEDDSHKHMLNLSFSQIVGDGVFIIFQIENIH